jgi:hydrogenase small subunit
MVLPTLDSTPHDPSGLDRRDFVKVCSIAAAAVGLPSEAAAAIVENVQAGRKPSVIWLHNQECTGCTESLLRTNHPTLDELIIDLISLDYHETLMVAAGHQAEEVLRTAMEENNGAYILVIEGAIPMKDDGVYCKIGGRTSIDLVSEVAESAGAIIAIGSCASWGGIPSAAPNPTGAVGAPTLLEGKTVVSIPGCPSNPYNFLGVALQYATFGTLPELDALGRPKFAYGRYIHEHCPRRAHFDAGRFVKQFGDEGHREGWCLYQMGCKGPVTRANCSTLHFGEMNDAWPIGIGAPCFGCTEEGVGFTMGKFETVEITDATPPATYPPIFSSREGPNPWATMALGGIIGGAIGGGIIAAKKVSQPSEDEIGLGEV